MTEEIKNRLEQIRAGKIPEGYCCKWGIMPRDWDYVPLSKLYRKCRKKNTGNSVSVVFTNSAVYGIIPQRDYFEKDIANSENINGYYIVQPNDYIYNPRISEAAPYGPFNKNNTGISGIVSPLYTVLTPKDEYKDSKYLQYFFASTQWYKYAYSIANYGARFDRMNIADADLLSLPVVFPPLLEQTKIAEILILCDKVIELHQSRIEEINKLKRACLNKMFPKKGSNVPEIRFPGFTDAWEQRKLGKLVQFSKGTGYSKSDLKNKGTPIILYGRLYTKYETVISEIDTYADEKPSSVFSNGGEVIVPASGETAEDISIASVVNKSGVLLGGDLNIITPPDNLDSAFLAISISNGKPHKDMAKIAQGKSIVHLHNSDLEKIDLAYPSYTEQIQISGYFAHIDHLITLHQRTLDEKHKQKKALMQLLLTGIVRIKI